MKEINQVINHNFEKDFFYDRGSLRTELNIKNQIKIFEEINSDVLNNVLTKLKETFPDAKIENWTQFFNLDRCLRFLIELNGQQRVISQLSIFGYFCVYEHSTQLVQDIYTYDETVFVNLNESLICDQLYKCFVSASNEPKWLHREVLEQIFEDFSIIDTDPLFSHKITIADILFTNHYL